MQWRKLPFSKNGWEMDTIYYTTIYYDILQGVHLSVAQSPATFGNFRGHFDVCPTGELKSN